jgi:hypothetical protein
MSENEWVFETEVNRLKVIPEKEYYLLHSNGAVNTDQFKGVFNALLDQMGQHPYRKLFIDIQQMKSTTLIARTWLLVNWIPKFYSQYDGIFYVAIINTKNFLEAITIELLAKAVMALGFDIRVSFHKTEEAALASLDIDS